MLKDFPIGNRAAMLRMEPLVPLDRPVKNPWRSVP